MPYDARVHSVMVTSPLNMAYERQIAREVIQEWNAIHSESQRIVLVPIGWETYSSPALYGRTQEINNQSVLEQSDLLIAVFQGRVNVATTDSPIRMVVGLKKHINAGKPTMIYVASEFPTYAKIDTSFHKTLDSFRQSVDLRGMIEMYNGADQFRTKLARQLTHTVEHFISDNDTVKSATQENILSDVERALLIEASKDGAGRILILPHVRGVSIMTHNMNFATKHRQHPNTEWRQTIHTLCSKGLLREHGNDNRVFCLTKRGYRQVSMLSMPPATVSRLSCKRKIKRPH